MKVYLNEIFRFFKKYLLYILIGGVLLGLLFGGFLYTRTQNDEETTEEPEVELSEERLENQAEPAYFRFYIVRPNGNIFTNNSLIDEIFNLENTTDNVLEATGINIERIEKNINEENEEENNSDSEPHKVVNVTRDNASNVITAAFDSGDRNSNLTLANYYYDFLSNEQLGVLSENSLYSVVEPRLVEIPEDVETDETGSESSQQTTSFSLTSFIINFVIGVIFSFFLLIVFFLMKELFSKKLNFAFTYDTGKQENFLLYDETVYSPDLINYFIGLPNSTEKVILSENNLENMSSLNNDLDLDTINNYQSILNINHLNDLKEIIILVSANNTSRKWYEKQFELSKMKNIQIKIVQVNI